MKASGFEKLNFYNKWCSFQTTVNLLLQHTYSRRLDALHHCQVVVSNIITRTDNGKGHLTIRNIKEHVDAMELDIVNNKNIGANELIKGGMHLNIGELVNFLSILLKRLNFKN